MRQDSPASRLPLPCPKDGLDAFLSAPSDGAVSALGEVDGDILVLGAGGKMGLHLCLLLQSSFAKLGKENRIVAASRFRSLQSRQAYEEHGIRTVVGDFRDREFVESLPPCPFVFYLVGAKFGTAGNPEWLREINITVAHQVAERFRDSTTVAFSTGCVYPFVSLDSGGSDESSPTDPVGDYAVSCLERERQFETVSLSAKTPVVLIRLNYSVEFRYGVLVDIGRKVMNGEALDLSMGFVNVIWQNDALNHIVQSLRLADSPPQPINIAGPELVEVRAIANRFGELFDTVPRFVGEEAPTAWLSNAARAHRLFGPPAVSLGTMIEWTAAWLARGGFTYDKPTGFERRDGRF